METIGVVGAGTMGCGIAQVFLERDYSVILTDQNEQQIKKGISILNKNLDRSVEKGKIRSDAKSHILGNLTTSVDLTALSQCPLVIEAVSEDINMKKSIFSQLDKICPAGSIFASNTSSLSITEISLATNRPENVIGMHFFYPAQVLQLVEIIKGLKTSEVTFEMIRNYSLSVGKTPIMVQESPGFIVNRLLIPMINEAICVYAEGIANASEIDNAMKLGANHPIGPLALADLIGLDIVLAIMENLHKEMGDDKYRPHPVLKKMVRGGLIGKKAKSGFFNY
jgi:3-hydroxybutyryl-CoA dehydrogenase